MPITLYFVGVIVWYANIMGKLTDIQNMTDDNRDGEETGLYGDFFINLHNDFFHLRLYY